MGNDVTLTDSDKKHRARFRELVDEAKAKGVTRKMIAVACEMTVSGVSQYYRGNRPIRFDAALKFSQFFNIPTEQLYSKVSEIVISKEMEQLLTILREIPESEYPRVRQMLLGVERQET